MKFSILLSAFFLCLQQSASAQCNILNSLGVINTPGTELIANMECTDAEGWTHYFHAGQSKILLSIKKNGQNIGSLTNGLVIKSGTLGSYGGGAFDLSNADYIDDDIWVVANRHWQITGATAVNAPVQIRFYLDNQDVMDVAQSVDDFGFIVDAPNDLLMFTLANGNGLPPFSTMTQPVSANITFYDMVAGSAPDWSGGSLNGFPYSEFQVNTLDIGGGAGFLIFTPEAPVAILGKITKPNSLPVPQAMVQAATSSIGTTNANGNYSCPSLLVGAAYEVVPSKNINPTEYISTIDLIALSRHLLGIEMLSTPEKLIAADATKNAVISFEDFDVVKKLLLGELAAFPNNSSWRFVPKSYAYPNPANPFSPPFPEKIVVNNLTDTLLNQHFTGIKIGDVADEVTFNPPMLNTAFYLPDLSTCNPGDTIKLDITVADFNNIRGFQFTLDWDASKLDFLSVGNFNLPGFNENNLGISQTNGGQLTFAWFHTNLTGSTLANGAYICKVSFVATGTFGDATPIGFSGAVTPALVVHQNLTQVVPGFQGGHVTIQNNSQLAATATILPAGCNGEAIGSINLSVTGGVPPLSFHWNNGKTTEDISNIPGGVYHVTVGDASSNCPKVFSFMVAPNGPMEIAATVTDMTCPSTVDGAIDIDLSGGGAPFSFLWSNGKTTEDLTNIYLGNYTVTVTDGAGCTATASFEVKNPNKITPNVGITNATSDIAENGAVHINYITGGTPPFSFLWNTGATQQMLLGVPMGDYIVTITDGIGCEHVFGYLVNVVTTSIENLDKNVFSVTLQPNPAQAGQAVLLKLGSQFSGEMTAEIFSVEGKKMSGEKFQVQVGENEHLITTPSITGVYLLKMQMGGGAQVWKRFIVQ